MEREQATLPFVVPSHLSKLFGLKASVIVEGEGAGGRDESERQRGREGERHGLIAPVGVMVRQLSRAHFFFYSFFLSVHVSFPPRMFLPLSLFCSSSHLHP